MKNLAKLVLTLGIPAVCVANETCCDSPVYVPQLDSNFEVSGGALFLKPYAENLGWSAVTDFLPFFTPNWSIQAIDPDYQAGFEVGARYFFCDNGIDLNLDWAHLRTSDSQSTTVTPVLQWVSPFCQTGPGTADTHYDSTGVGELTHARGKVKFHYDVVNLDLGIYLNLGCRVKVRLFTGLTGANIEEHLTSEFDGDPAPPLITFNNKSTFWGIGPRLGLSSRFELCGGLQFIGEMAPALLFGRMQPAQYHFGGSSEALEAVDIAVNREHISSKRVSNTVFAFDAHLGLAYDYCFCDCYHLILEAGYMGVIYLNPLSGYETNENVLPLELGSLSTGSMKHVQSNFSQWSLCLIEF